MKGFNRGVVVAGNAGINPGAPGQMFCTKAIVLDVEGMVELLVYRMDLFEIVG